MNLLVSLLNYHCYDFGHTQKDWERQRQTRELETDGKKKKRNGRDERETERDKSKRKDRQKSERNKDEVRCTESH